MSDGCGRAIAACGVLLTVLAVLSCADRTEPAAGHEVSAFVSIAPQAFFVEKVGGDHVHVEVLVPPGQSPAIYEPTAQQMARLAEADVYFRIGVPFEASFMEKVRDACEGLRIVDTRRGITLRRIEKHAHGGEHEHADTEGAPDPHIWLSPPLVKKQAKTIGASLAEIDLDNARAYEENLETFQAELDDLDARMAKVLEPVKGRTIYVFHPAFGYFCDAYGLEQEAVEVSGKEPSARQLGELIERARKENVRVIFVQRQFSDSSARKVAEAIGGVVVHLDPLARDYMANLERMAAAVESGLSGRDAGRAPMPY